MQSDDIKRAQLLTKAEFILGMVDLSQLPESDVPEIAFAGRSNVGKSSLLNALTGRKALARTSNTPGRTQQLNFFNVDNQLYLVDMPGYGYAKVSKKMRSSWDSLIFDYLRGRPNLKCVFVLIDSRHGIKESDTMIMEMLDDAAVSYRIVLTKIDKEKNTKPVIEAVEAELKNHPAAWPYVYITSSDEKIGMEELQKTIFDFL